jgi:hypothetical protein
MTDINRGPWHAMLDRQALARQSQMGESYARAFTKVYEDPANAEIRDRARYDHIAKAMDATHGTRLSLIPAAKAAAPADPRQDYIHGPAHAKMHSMATDFQRAHPWHSYKSAYSRVYSAPENSGLREKVRNEHLGASMGAVAKAAPPDALQDDVSPGSANYELHRLVVTRMKNNPRLSYEQAFTHEYLAPENRSLKERVTAEGVLHMRRLAPVPSFPAYTAPGHRG